MKSSTSTTVEELHSRLRQGKVYKPEKVEQALMNFFRETNISTLRELALRAVADEIGEKAASRRQREGLEPASPTGAGDGVYELECGCAARDPGGCQDCRSPRRTVVRRLRRDTSGSTWTHQPRDRDALQRNIALAEQLGATVVRVKADRPGDGLIEFAKRGDHPRRLRTDRGNRGEILAAIDLESIPAGGRRRRGAVVPLGEHNA